MLLSILNVNNFKSSLKTLI